MSARARPGGAAIHGRQQIGQRGAKRAGGCAAFRRGRHRAREAVRRALGPRLEDVDDLAHLLVLEQPADQLGPRIVPGFRAIPPRQQHLRLDAQQPRGHLEVLRRFVQPQRADADQELLGDPRDRDVVDVDLLLAEEREQQVEGPAEMREFDDE